MRHSLEIVKVIRVSIPDDDVQGWVRVFKEAGLSKEEAKTLLLYLNQSFFEQTYGDMIAQHVRDAELKLAHEKGKPLSEDEKQRVRSLVIQGLRNTWIQNLSTGAQWVRA